VLLAAGADPSLRNGKGWGPQHSAANAGFFDCVLRLVQVGWGRGAGDSSEHGGEACGARAGGARSSAGAGHWAEALLRCCRPDARALSLRLLGLWLWLASGGRGLAAPGQQRRRRGQAAHAQAAAAQAVLRGGPPEAGRTRAPPRGGLGDAGRGRRDGAGGRGRCGGACGCGRCQWARGRPWGRWQGRPRRWQGRGGAGSKLRGGWRRRAACD
jgi:hypothetical protein